MLSKITNFLKTILKSIEDAQMARAKNYIRFHNKGLFNNWE
jgi:hypothetical protein